MAAPDDSSRMFPWLAPKLALGSSAGLAAVIAAADAITPTDVIIATGFVIPLFLSAGSGNGRYLWSLALTMAAACVGVHFVHTRPNLPDHAWVALALLNRCFVALNMILTASLLHRLIRAWRLLDGQRAAEQAQNEELEAINKNLSQREEEITRQNEELQASTEELERSSEELRVTNEELATREKMLEQLLELSRTLTADQERATMLRKLCEALEVLTNGLPSAIIERSPAGGLHIPCYHGFGPDGIESEELPLAQSFSGLIMSLGQTGYLEDVELRRDLVLPKPRQGPPIRAVLSSPLRVHGKCTGTIEIYSRHRHTWDESQIALLESLSAQASISLQSSDQIDVIQRERRRFEGAFRMIPFGLTVADDPDGANVRLNPAAASLFGVPLDENIALHTPAGGRLKRAFYRANQAVPVEQLPIVRALRGEEIHNEEYEVLLSQNKRLTLLTSAAPIYDSRGNVQNAVCAFVDISAQKLLQRELDLRRREAEEASVRKTRFLAAVSHDIRTPVNAINLMAEVIRRTVGTPALSPQIPQLAERLQANALSLADLVTDVLDLARFDSGKVELLESEFSLNELIRDECQHLLPLAQDKKLELVVDLPDRPVWVRSDRVKLARVIGNLVSNAIKFTDQGTVRAGGGCTADREVVIAVRDTGHGIAPEHLSHIFDEFAQLRNPERDREKGAGLGLAICKRLVELMNGTIEVTSDVGVGSTFTVRLPSSCVLLRLDPSPASPVRPNPAERARTRELTGLHVLLVEDHAATRDGTLHILADEGVECGSAGDGRSALTLIATDRWDVLLLDMMLPDMDGREILKKLARNRPSRLRAVIVMTGDLTPERLEEVKHLGGDAVIGKPIDVYRLIEVLKPLARARPE